MVDLFNHIKIKYKLFIILFIEVILISSFSMVALQYSFAAYDDQLYKQVAGVLNLSTENIEIKLKDINRLSSTIFSDNDVQDCLRIINKEGSSYERHLAVAKLRSKLSNWSVSENYISSICLMDINNNEYLAGNKVTRMDEQRKNGILSAIKGKNGESVWILPARKDNYIISARDVRDTRNLNLAYMGALIIRVDPSKLVDEPLSASGNYDGSLVILSGDNIIFPIDGSFNIDVKKLDFEQYKGYRILNIDNKKYLTTQITSAYTGWTYVNMISYKQVLSNANTIRTYMILIYIAFLAIVVYMGIKFSKSITKPIEKLMIKMKRVEKGNFEIEPEIISGDNEIARLSSDFDIMTGEINNLIKENYMKQISIKEAELRELQGQINPHFLYNTLESIYWLAKTNKQDSISVMAKSLGDLLRSSINNKKSVISLYDEIQILQNYILIQKIRYEERLEFQINIEEKLLEYSIPKLTLQPIIENSINYGLESIVGVCRIEVSAIKKDQWFEISVTDNGPGAEEDLIEKLRRGEIKPKGSGIGLLNINERIKITFGELYGININSKIGKYMTVVIKLPYKECQQSV